MAVFARGEGDHALTALGFGRSARTVVSELPVPRRVTKHKSVKFMLSLCSSLSIFLFCMFLSN